MSQQRGVAVRLAYQEETTYGQIPAAIALKKLHYRSGVPQMTRELHRSEVLTTDRNPRKAVRGNVGVQWTTVTELAPQLGPMLKAALGTSTPAGGGPYTHTIKVHTSIPSFLFETGHMDLAEYLIYLGCKLNQMSMDITPAGHIVVNLDWMGQVECQGLKFDAQTATFNLDATLTGATSTNTATIISQNDAGVTGVLALYNHTGEFQNNEVIADNGSVPGSADADGTLGDSSLDAAVADPGHTPFDGFSISTITEGGSAIAIVSAISGLTINNAVDGDNYVIGGGGRRRNLPEGYVSVSGTIEALFESMALYNKALRYTESSLVIVFKHGTGAGSAGNEQLTLTIPELVMTPNSPPVEGPKGVRVKLPFEAYYDNDAAASAIHFELKNAEATI
jgi:hypothetical protein